MIKLPPRISDVIVPTAQTIAICRFSNETYMPVSCEEHDARGPRTEEIQSKSTSFYCTVLQLFWKTVYRYVVP